MILFLSVFNSIWIILFESKYFIKIRNQRPIVDLNEIKSVWNIYYFLTVLWMIQWLPMFYKLIITIAQWTHKTTNNKFNTSETPNKTKITNLSTSTLLSTSTTNPYSSIDSVSTNSNGAKTCTNAPVNLSPIPTPP